MVKLPLLHLVGRSSTYKKFHRICSYGKGESVLILLTNKLLSIDRDDPPPKELFCR